MEQYYPTRREKRKIRSLFRSDHLVDIARRETMCSRNWMDLVFCPPILNLSILIYRERFGERNTNLILQK
jgi:hypothetical protein